MPRGQCGGRPGRAAKLHCTPPQLAGLRGACARAGARRLPRVLLASHPLLLRASDPPPPALATSARPALATTSCPALVSGLPVHVLRAGCRARHCPPPPPRRRPCRHRRHHHAPLLWPRTPPPPFRCAPSAVDRRPCRLRRCPQTAPQLLFVRIAKPCTRPDACTARSHFPRRPRGTPPVLPWPRAVATGEALRRTCHHCHLADRCLRARRRSRLRRDLPSTTRA